MIKSLAKYISILTRHVPDYWEDIRTNFKRLWTHLPLFSLFDLYDWLMTIPRVISLYVLAGCSSSFSTVALSLSRFPFSPWNVRFLSVNLFDGQQGNVCLSKSIWLKLQYRHKNTALLIDSWFVCLVSFYQLWHSYLAYHFSLQTTHRSKKKEKTKEKGKEKRRREKEKGISRQNWCAFGLQQARHAYFMVWWCMEKQNRTDSEASAWHITCSRVQSKTNREEKTRTVQHANVWCCYPCMKKKPEMNLFISQLDSKIVRSIWKKEKLSLWHA